MVVVCGMTAIILSVNGSAMRAEEDATEVSQNADHNEHAGPKTSSICSGPPGPTHICTRLNPKTSYLGCSMAQIMP